MREDDIKRAYDEMNPTPEAEARMLDNILAAANAAETNDRIVFDETGSVEGDGVLYSPAPVAADSDEPHGVHTTASAPAATGATRERRKKPAWIIALPIAACVILLAGIGVFALGTDPVGTSGTTTLNAAKSSAESAMSDQAAPDSSGGNATSSTAPGDDFAHTLPIIELKAGNTLHIVTTDGSVPLVIDESKIGQELGAATAKSEDGASTMGCTVYEYRDEKYPYAIRYDGDPEYHLAIPDKD